MYCRSFTALLVFILFLSLNGCARKETRAVEQLAVIPFDNLSADAGLNWTGRAVATAIVYDLDAAPDVHAKAVDSVPGAYGMPATRALQGYFTTWQGRLELHAVVEDLFAAKALDSYQISGPQAEGPLPLLNQLAKKLTPSARTFATSNAEAFHVYGEAIAATDRPAMQHGFEQATRLDPHFAAAYAGWAESLLSTGDREGGLAVLARAEGQAQDPVDRAELKFLATNASGDSAARMAALEELTRLTPANGQEIRDLAALQLSQRRFADAVHSYEAAARILPDDPAIWNELGYAHAYTQDLDGARRAIERYRQLAPDDANAADSLGEVNFYLGDFAAAEKAFLEADRKSAPGTAGTALAKAAQARWMVGDLAGADALFGKYTSLAKPVQRAAVNYQQAQWDFLTGRRKAAMTQMEQVISTVAGDTQVLALSQLSLWKLDTGAVKDAMDLANRAVAIAQSPAGRELAGNIHAIASMQPSMGASRLANTFALLFARKFADAQPLLDAAYRESNPSNDGQPRALLAWADIELGRVDGAGKLVALYPIPLSSGDAMFATLIFPRFLYWRGVAMEKAGKPDEAKRNYDLFLKYAGDVPDVFGEAAKARSRNGS